MDTGQDSDYSKAWCDGYNQAQSYRKEIEVQREVLIFDDAQLDSAIAKAERLKKILADCQELIKGLPNPPPQEMTFDEFIKRLSDYIVETARCQRGKVS